MKSVRQTEYFISSIYRQDDVRIAVEQANEAKAQFLEDSQHIEEVIDEKIDFVVLPSIQSGSHNKIFAIISLSFFKK